MTDFMDRISKLSPKRLALLALEQQEQIEDAARRVREPLAIVGMGCRIPGGVEDPDQFWELLRSGRDAISEVPADRWDIDAYFDPDPDAPGKMSARSGGFLASVGQFDPAFFGIAPREALTMDPQQRLLLEVTWEALEHAGIAADRLAGSATGVFVGICNSDHFHRVMGRGVDSIDAYLASGNAHSVAAGRISYCLGLQGPALSIDTACSSSLVAMHVACRSLRSGEIRMALVGGVNVMCAPETTIALSRSHMLAPDGRCKTFDASADGFARGEGCGVLVLKRLSDALADGDRVLALVRGSAANQDGRSGGLTVPNGPAQEAVIRAALADAGVAPADIDYVEAHGTGTSLGDPIEVRALAGALGAGRSPPTRHSSSGPSRRTSDTSSPPPASQASSRPCSPCSTSAFRRTCISASPVRTSPGPNIRSACWRRARPGRAARARGSLASVPLASAAPTRTWCSRRRHRSSRSPPDRRVRCIACRCRPAAPRRSDASPHACPRRCGATPRCRWPMWR